MLYKVHYFYKDIYFSSLMPLIDDKGKIFGTINIIDFVILSFVLVFVLSLFLYSKYPLHLKEHQDATFQVVFTNIPDAIAQEVFVPGTPLIATYSKKDNAVITTIEKVILYRHDIEGKYNVTSYLLTLNGSLEIDADGDLLFNGNDVAPGNFHDFQVGNSYLSGQIWRVNYEHSLQTIELFVKLNENASLTAPGDIVLDSFGNKLGEVTAVNADTLTLSLQADVYDGELFVSEMPIQKFSPLYFWINNISYKGTIVEVNP